MLEPGDYKATVVSYGVAEANKPGGDPSVVVEFEVEGGEKISGFFSLSTKALKYTLEKLLNCGLRNLSDLGSGAPVHEVFDSKKDFTINVVHEQYDGKTRAKVAFVNSGPRWKSMEPQRVKSFLSQLDNRYEAMKREQGYPSDFAKDDSFANV